MEEMVPVFIVLGIFISIIWIVKIVSDNRIRHKLIDKGLVKEDIRYLYPSSMENYLPGSMKWGMVLVGIGLAFLIGQLAPLSVGPEITIALIFLFSGLGLLIYYFVGKSVSRNKK